jgi:glycosyltransferase involved in cell wall biosynthesis
MSATRVLVALATAWGPRFGGINAFNAELLKSLGILPGRDYELVCVVPAGAETQERIDECRLRFKVDLRCIDGAAEIIQQLGATNEPERFVWIGHDDKTGPLALELKALAPGSRAVLVHHMAHGAYQSVKKGISAGAAEKEEAQRELFRQADLCLAVGPMLRSHLDDLLGTLPKRPPVGMLVPGLAAPTEHGVELRDSPPENYVAFVAGRLGAEDDRIKQGRLALRAFGNAVVRADEHSAIRKSPKLRMRGVRPEEEESLRDLLTEEARGAVAFDLQDFTEDRDAYFRDLASASVAMMPSWHEGFGLTAWEAIASAVPVVIGEQSGVYRLLDEECSGAGLGHSVANVQIAGSTHTEKDIEHVADALLDFGRRSGEAKQEALTLRRNLLTLGYDWKGCAVSLLEAAEKNFDVRLTAERAAAAPPPPSTPVPVDLTVPEALRVPAPRPWNRELQLPTSMLLAARDEVVRFDPEREPILARMLEWASATPPLAARLLFGPGGMGKTRLALELARRSQGSGWLSLWIPAAPPPEWVSILEQRGERPALVVIDYADARPAAALEALRAALESLRTGDSSPVRALLLARSESWLGTLAQHPSCPQDVAAWLPNIEPVALPPWTSDIATRSASYTAALEDYATAIGIPPPPNAYVPDLGDKVFERPLYLHLAALAALEGQRPESAEALLRNQLQREWLYWCSIHGDKLASYDEWADTLAYVVLRQGASVSELPSHLAAALQRSYPGGDERVAPLEPDLIAEALLRERLAGRRGAEILDLALGADPEQPPPPGIAVLARLAAHPRAFDRKGVPSAWAGALIAAIARHWPRHPNAWLAAAHSAEFGLGRMLDAAWEQLNAPTRASVAAVLTVPDYSTNLFELTVAVHRQQVNDAQEPAAKARALNNLSVALSHYGDAASRAQAVTAAREAAQIARQYTEAEPAVYLRMVAMALNNIAFALSEERDAASRREALAAIREAVQIYRQLAQIHLTAYLPELGVSLNNLVSALSEQDDVTSVAEALSAAHDAVQIYRQLAETHSAAYLPELADSLNNLGIRLSMQGDAASRVGALAATREAVGINRQLAETQPAAYLPNLAVSLNTLAIRLSEQADTASRAEALSCAREAVQMLARLHTSMPAAFERNLGIAARNLHRLATENGRDPEEELRAALEAAAG